MLTGGSASAARPTILPSQAEAGQASETSPSFAIPTDRSMDLIKGLPAYRRFCGDDLTGTLSRAETALRGAGGDLVPTLAALHATKEAIVAAGELKRVAGQVNVAIHALGILLCLPHILQPGERVEYVSLGAGNTGRPFDLETDQRVAEFKFIAWQGGPESIRQNSLFKDFFFLAEHQTPKRKYIYLLETDRPLRFLNGGRALSSVLKDAPLARAFRSNFGEQYQTVRDYFVPRQNLVRIQDVSAWLPGLAAGEGTDEAV